MSHKLTAPTSSQQTGRTSARPNTSTPSQQTGQTPTRTNTPSPSQQTDQTLTQPNMPISTPTPSQRTTMSRINPQQTTASRINPQQTTTSSDDIFIRYPGIKVPRLLTSSTNVSPRPLSNKYQKMTSGK